MRIALRHLKIGNEKDSTSFKNWKRYVPSSFENPKSVYLTSFLDNILRLWRYMKSNFGGLLEKFRGKISKIWDVPPPRTGSKNRLPLSHGHHHKSLYAWRWSRNLTLGQQVVPNIHFFSVQIFFEGLTNFWTS